jgi:hypothetical protein
MLIPYQTAIYIFKPPIPCGAVSPTGNLFEAILLLAGCLDSGITDRLPPPVLSNILNKTMITTQVTTEGTCKAITRNLGTC